MQDLDRQKCVKFDSREVPVDLLESLSISKLPLEVCLGAAASARQPRQSTVVDTPADS